MSTTSLDPTVTAVATQFDLATGLTEARPSLQRRLSDMSGMYADTAALSAAVDADDVLTYEFYDFGVPSLETEVAYGTSITYPGKVGDEYFMTKGHFHTRLESAEIYLCLSGQGLMLMESPEGDVQVEEFRPGRSVYVPGRYAHRSINTSPDEPLITFFAFPGDAGHDYGTIETKGFRRIVLERDGAPVLVDNPRWQS
ncbi:glucose-6-phosphate isomerase [Humibacter sp. BT305]|uniref:glucose-6-phosphate isomerase n=1 Tax=Cnuibacter physcomitrellae TaxID=1619308 RepID=A0A1X9LLC1_9MICO|nr:glucose-6-phosphate isomerase [Cnuibacter physcomitrellae]ARJ03919.1 glucose-6-phosphate isomerase [Cnuibacter physcomitrellae]AXH34344.1 glucose-6-phosphate isomerase [Humibacter sp. BT305]GGI39809.1 glucose-6-phosphate isomerase [Cnuibacter physcomitrellae]